MARPFRCQYEGAIYHVTVRGNERRAIFRDDRDRRRLVDRLRALLDVHHVRPVSGLAFGNWLRESCSEWALRMWGCWRHTYAIDSRCQALLAEISPTLRVRGLPSCSEPQWRQSAGHGMVQV